MGKCAKRTKSIIKHAARALTPIGIGLIGDIVGIVATTDWANDEKRENAVAMARGAFKARGIEARGNAIRLGVEAAVAALTQGQEALAELGTMEPDDAAMLDTDGDGLPG